MKYLIESLKQKFLSIHKPSHFEYVIKTNSDLAKMRRASVLVPINIQKDEENKKIKYFTTMTKRSDNLKSFAGEICFIGGNFDHGIDKDEIETALREAREEVGMKNDCFEILAQTCPIVTYHGNLITPIVCYLDKNKFKPKLNNQEVELMFELELEKFLYKKNYVQYFPKVDDEEFVCNYYQHKLNGKKISIEPFTCLISIITASILYSKNPDFKMDEKIQFDFNNVNYFLETYLLNKSKNLVKYLIESKDLVK